MFDKRLMALCPESKKYIVGNILLQWLELCMNAVMIGLIAKAAERLYRGELTPQNAAPGLVVILVTIILRFFVVRYAVRMSYLASRTVKRKLRDLIYKKLLKLGMSYREKVTTAEIVQESVEGVDQLESYFGQYVPQFFYAFIAPLTLFVIFWAAGSLRTGLVLLLCVPLIPGTIMMVQKIAKKILAKYWDQYTQLGSTFLENLQGMTTLKIYQADEYKHEQMNRESEQFRVVTMKVLTMQLNSIIIMDLLAYGGAAVGIVLATRSFVAGELDIAPCLFMILLSADFFLPMRKLGSYFHVAMNGMAASDRIFKFLATEEPTKKTVQFPEGGGNFLLKSVCFSYDGERDVLNRVNMQIPKNSFVGIVGESGSGKSTIASLLTGRNTIDSGTIMIGPDRLTECSEESLMKGITYIGSTSYLFKGTVRDNLLMGDPGADDDRLWKVLEECRMDKFLQSKEGLSNIDVESEEIILNRIRALRGQKTIILISHRLVNTRDADRIYVLDKGKVAESGTHRELMKWGGTYSVLWRTQQKLERFGRDDESGEEWLTGEMEKIAATGEIDLAGVTGRIGNTGRIGDTKRIGDTGRIGNTGRISDTGRIGDTRRIGNTGELKVGKEGDQDE